MTYRGPTGDSYHSRTIVDLVWSVFCFLVWAAVVALCVVFFAMPAKAQKEGGPDSVAYPLPQQQIERATTRRRAISSRQLARRVRANMRRGKAMWRRVTTAGLPRSEIMDLLFNPVIRVALVPAVVTDVDVFGGVGLVSVPEDEGESWMPEPVTPSPPRRVQTVSYRATTLTLYDGVLVLLTSVVGTVGYGIALFIWKFASMFLSGRILFDALGYNRRG